MGTVIQAALERFYNDELWRLLPPEQLRDRLLELAEESFKLEIARRFVDWRLSPSAEELRQIIKDGVLGYMRTLKAHMLLGPYARAEVELLGYVNKYTPVGGRADVIIRREDTGVTILDGKNSKRYKDGKGGYMTFTDPDQLRWYAMLFYLQHQHIPERLGFVYYRYPFGMPIVDDEGKDTGGKETGMVWVPCTKDDLKGLAQRAVETRKAMDREHFEATPSYKQCKYCDFETICPPRQTQRSEHKRSPRVSKKELMPEEYTVFSLGGVGSKSGDVG